MDRCQSSFFQVIFIFRPNDFSGYDEIRAVAQHAVQDVGRNLYFHQNATLNANSASPPINPNTKIK
jgi:hypothetical protein